MGTAEGCALPKIEHREMNTLPVEQLHSFLREARKSGGFELYYQELATGLRRGELLGLKLGEHGFGTRRPAGSAADLPPKWHTH